MSSLNGAAYVYPRSPFFWLNMFEYFARIIRARFVTESPSPPWIYTRFRRNERAIEKEYKRTRVSWLILGGIILKKIKQNKISFRENNDYKRLMAGKKFTDAIRCSFEDVRSLRKFISSMLLDSAMYPMTQRKKRAFEEFFLN